MILGKLVMIKISTLRIMFVAHIDHRNRGIGEIGRSGFAALDRHRMARQQNGTSKELIHVRTARMGENLRKCHARENRTKHPAGNGESPCQIRRVDYNDRDMKNLPILFALGLSFLTPLVVSAGETRVSPVHAAAAKAPFKPSNIKGFTGKWTGVVYLENSSNGGFEAYRVDSFRITKTGPKTAKISGKATLEVLGQPNKVVRLTGKLSKPKQQQLKKSGHKGFIKRASATLSFSNGTKGAGYFQISEINGFKGSGTSVTFKRAGGWKASSTDARFSKL